MPGEHAPATETPARKRADARRNEQALLDAAAAVFVVSGVDAPVREIAARASPGRRPSDGDASVIRTRRS